MFLDRVRVNRDADAEIKESSLADVVSNCLIYPRDSCPLAIRRCVKILKISFHEIVFQDEVGLLIGNSPDGDSVVYRCAAW